MFAMLEAKLPPPKTGGRCGKSHQPVRRRWPRDEQREQRRRNQQQQRADDRPVASAELRDRKGIWKTHQRTDQARVAPRARTAARSCSGSRPSPTGWRRRSRSARSRSRNFPRGSTRTDCGARCACPWSARTFRPRGSIRRSSARRGGASTQGCHSLPSTMRAMSCSLYRQVTVVSAFRASTDAVK